MNLMEDIQIENKIIGHDENSIEYTNLDKENLDNENIELEKEEDDLILTQNNENNNDVEEPIDFENDEITIEQQETEEFVKENPDFKKEDQEDPIIDGTIISKENMETEDISNDDPEKLDKLDMELNETNDEIQVTVNSFIEDIIDNLINNVMRSKDIMLEDEFVTVEKSFDEDYTDYHEFGVIEEAVEEHFEDIFDRHSGQELKHFEFENEESFHEKMEDDEPPVNVEEEINNEEEESKLSKEELIQELKNANIEEENLKKINTSLQHKIGDYMRKRRVEQTSAAIAEEKGIIDFEQKYIKQMENLTELRYEYEFENDQYKMKIEDLQNETTNREERVKKEKEKFQNYRYLISQKSINTRTGKSISPKDLEAINFNEEKKESLVVETRLISIKLQNEVNKIESTLKSKEELADGLHLIDFEQFKIENQSYNEKLEERTEDLLKLRKKITSNVHILTHVKEKLEFVKFECDLERDILKEIDGKLTSSRDQLTSFKQFRDKLRSSNQKFKKSCGMLGNQDLLRNYEDCVDTVDIQQEKMNDMKNKQIKLTLRNQALQMKIDNARLETSH